VVIKDLKGFRFRERPNIGPLSDSVYPFGGLH